MFEILNPPIPALPAERVWRLANEQVGCNDRQAKIVHALTADFAKAVQETHTLRHEVGRLRDDLARLTAENSALRLAERQGRNARLWGLFRGVKKSNLPRVGAPLPTMWVLFLAYLKGDKAAARAAVDRLLDEWP